jgi:hypothetical protein
MHSTSGAASTNTSASIVPDTALGSRAATNNGNGSGSTQPRRLSDVGIDFDFDMLDFDFSDEDLAFHTFIF